CSGPPAPSPLRPSADTRRKRGRTTDPVACPECAVVLASRSTGVNHLVTTHGYDRKEALRLLQREPPAPPRVPNAPQRCPHCPRTCPSAANVNRHAVAMHRDEARIKRASMLAVSSTHRLSHMGGQDIPNDPSHRQKRCCSSFCPLQR
ncbi:Zinc finger C2H2, partial [Perkinsela sp. CCAP 1560/4]